MKKSVNPKMLKDFKAFINRANIVGLAVGVIIGTTFTAIINSLVKDIIMPLITAAFGGGSIAGAALVINNVPMYLADGSLNPQAILWNYGNFIQAIINFLIITATIFIGVRVAMRIKNNAVNLLEKTFNVDIDGSESKEEEPKTTEELLAEILQELKAQKTPLLESSSQGSDAEPAYADDEE